MELTYEQVKNLKSVTSNIIAKQNTISEIDHMIKNLTQKPEPGTAYLRSCQITVGDRKLGLSEREIPQVLALLETARINLSQKITQLKEEILLITSLEEDSSEK